MNAIESRMEKVHEMIIHELVFKIDPVLNIEKTRYLNPDQMYISGCSCREYISLA